MPSLIKPPVTVCISLLISCVTLSSAAQTPGTPDRPSVSTVPAKSTEEQMLATPRVSRNSSCATARPEAAASQVRPSTTLVNAFVAGKFTNTNPAGSPGLSQDQFVPSAGEYFSNYLPQSFQHPGLVQSSSVAANYHKYFTLVRATPVSSDRARMFAGRSTEPWTKLIGWQPGVAMGSGTSTFAWDYNPIYLGSQRQW